jgi:hypothetical protein
MKSDCCETRCLIMFNWSLAIVKEKPASSVTSPVVVLVPTTLVVGLKLKKSPDCDANTVCGLSLLPPKINLF